MTQGEHDMQSQDALLTLSSMIDAPVVGPPSNSPFQELVDQALEIVVNSLGDWTHTTRLNDFPEPIYIKNVEGVIVYGNDAFRSWFANNGSPIGRATETFLDKPMLELAKQTDQLIVNGLKSLDFEHTCRGPDGQLWSMTTHKRNIAYLGNPGMTIFGVSRWKETLAEADVHPRIRLAEQHHRFLDLDEADRDICKLIGHGRKVREIAEHLQITSRAVEQRKRKLLEVFELEQTIDLIKMLVRLQDGGFVDLGL